MIRMPAPRSRHLQRSLLARVAILGLTLPVAAPLAVAGVSPAGPAAAVDCATEAADEAAAVAMAMACGQDVAVISSFNEWDTLWATPDGLLRQEYSTAAVRTKVAGPWTEIDTSITPGSEGLTVAAPVNPMVFSDGTPGQPLARIARNGHELTMWSPFPVSQPIVSGSTVTYPSVLPDVDLVVVVNDDGTGFAETLVVYTAEAATDSELADVSFPIETSNGLAIETDGGGFVAVDDSGAQVFTSPTPLMWDSSGEGYGSLTAGGPPPATERVRAPLEGDRVAGMPVDVSADAVAITPDQGMLSDPATQWPVFIDPGVTGNRYEWAMIQSGFGGDDPTYKFSGDQGVGLCDVSVVSSCVQDNKKRLIWEYNGLGTIGGLNANQIISATFSAYGVHSYDCENHNIQAYRLPGISASTTWDNHASYWTSDRYVTQRAVHHKSASGCDSPRWIEFNVTSVAQFIANGNYSTTVIGLRAQSETCMHCGWKRYRWDAKFSVVYNRYPNAPASQHMLVTGSSTQYACSGSPGPVLRDATPDLKATISDPDGGNVSADYLVETSGGTDIWNPAKDTAKASPSVHTATPPALTTTAGSFRWTVAAVDPYNLTKAGSTCYFQVDLQPPTTQPGVTPVTTGVAAVYVENGTSGGVGALGKFTFDNGGVTDVVSYNYSFNSDALGSNVTVASGATVSFTPSMPGTQRLYVQSVDKAGWTGPTRLYKFNVAFPSVDGWWQLDEGADSTSADASGSGRTLSLTSISWVDGIHAELGGEPDRYALRFDAASDVAKTSGPVVDTTGSFTVMAFVKLDATSNVYAAVAQDGLYQTAFKLGHHNYSDVCPPAAGTSCWAFWLWTEDHPTAGQRVVAAAAVPVTTGQWVHLTGVYRADTGTVRVYVCDPLLGEIVGSGEAAATSGMWMAGEDLVVGKETYDTGGAPYWPGVVDEVRVWNNYAFDEADEDPDKIIRVCTGADEPMRP